MNNSSDGTSESAWNCIKAAGREKGIDLTFDAIKMLEKVLLEHATK